MSFLLENCEFDETDIYLTIKSKEEGRRKGLLDISHKFSIV